MAKKMLIDATHPEETRVVVVDGNKVDDFDFESVNKKQLSGNIYLAKVTRVEPSLQAAFVEYGGNRHGFLAFAEIHPDYYQIPVADREALVAEEAALVREEAEAATRGAASTAKSRRSSKNGERAQARGDTGAARADDATAGAETTDPENGATATATGTDGRAKDAEAGASENRASGTSEERASGTSEERASGTGEERSGRGRRGGRRRGGKDASSPRHGPSGAFDVIEPDGGAPARGVSGMETAGEEQADEAPATATEASTRTESAAAAPAADRAAEGAPASAGAPARTAATPDDAVAEPDPAAAVAHEAVAEDAAGGPSFGEPLADAEASEEPTAATGEPASSPDALGETGAAPADPSPVADTDEPRRDDPATPNEPDAAGAPDDEDDGPSRSMAEDTGLGEDDVVRGEVEAAAEGGSEAGGDAPARAKPRRRKRAKDAAEGAPAAEAEETGAKPKRSRRGAKASAKGDKAGRKARKPEAEPADERPAASDGATEEVEAVPAEVDTVGAEDLREEALAHRAIRRRRYKIQDVVKSRQIMLVQVVKEERGNKGAALTTYLSLAGRYCVLMPNTARGGGISRKITNAADRKRLREIVGELEVPEGMGLIVRTAGAERTRAEIRRDYEFLLRQWEQVRSTTLESSAPCLIYEEGSLIKRAIRDLYSKEIEQVLVEGEAGYREAKDYMKMLMPSHAKNVQQYSEPTPLYIRHQVESYLNGMFSPVVQLKSGGYIVIGVTEALVAIDVNSGRSTREGSIEDTAVKTNLEAADEVARQLRLRDLAGLIVIDFIDMDERRNNAAVEKRMKERLKTDRARIQVGRISAFGLMEMSRQRLRPGMLEATTRPCHHCHGQGMIRSDESMALGILREIEEEGVKHRTAEIVATMPVGIANYIMNFKRAHLARIEERYDLAVQLLGDPAMSSPDYRIDRAKAAKQAPATAEPAVTATSVIEAAEAEDAPVETPEEAAPARSGDDGDGSGKKRRRGKRGGRRRRDGEGAELPGSGSATTSGADEAAEDEQETAGEDEAEESRGQGRRGRRRGRGKRRGGEVDGGTATAAPGEDAADPAVFDAAAPDPAVPETEPVGAGPADTGLPEAVLPRDAEPEPGAEAGPAADAEPLPLDADGDPIDAAAEAPETGEPETGAPVLSDEADPNPAEQSLPDEMRAEVPIETVEETPLPEDRPVDAAEAAPVAVPLADEAPGLPEPEADPSAPPAPEAVPDPVDAPAGTPEAGAVPEAEPLAEAPTPEAPSEAETAADRASDETERSAEEALGTEPHRERPKRRGWWSLRR